MSTTASAPAGWYPNPADAATQRWWNGVSWSDHVAPATISPVLPTPEVTVPHSDGNKPTVQSPNTVWIWLLAFGPFIAGLVAAVTEAFLLAAGMAPPGADISPGMVGFLGILVGLVPLWIFAGLDIKALRLRGYQTASILFMLLLTPLVYFVVRGRKLKRDGVRSRGPELALVIVIVLSLFSRSLGAIASVL